jgi:uncharacterized repeat protein (TIGR01451 family)
MDKSGFHMIARGSRLVAGILGGLFLFVVTLMALYNVPAPAHADPIDPPEGYPKFTTSLKSVTPTLAATGGQTLYYSIEIRNTGAYTAEETYLTDVMPFGTTYNWDATASVSSTFSFITPTLQWTGDVGFDETVVVNFSVSVSPTLEGAIRNTAVISQSLIAKPVEVTAETIVTDVPILAIEKSSQPPKPGPNKTMTYTISMVNQGQPAVNLPITVTDSVPTNTTPLDIGPDGQASPGGDVVTWTRNVDLQLGESSDFWFSVTVNDVPSGTVITNDSYQVASDLSGVSAGEPYTVTVIDPIFQLAKSLWPDPPGSNRELTYTLRLRNEGSLATNLVITDRVPAGSTYVRGGSEASGLVSWFLSTLDTDEAAAFTFTVFISDVAGIEIANDDYGVCSAEGVCLAGEPLTSTIEGPHFVATASLDPIAKKPGGGTGPVTPTLAVRNLGPGNALDAQAILEFDRISVGDNDLIAIPAIGTLPPFPPGPFCGSQCKSYVWIGSLDVGSEIIFTTLTPQSTIGGSPGTIYSTTVTISDTLANTVTVPVSATASGEITHFANLLPNKQAPSVIGAGHVMTYTISIRNAALSTDGLPWLTDTVPLNTSVVGISDGGVSQTLTNSTVVSWTLPQVSTGGSLDRSFSVRVADDLVSGTQIVNNDYRVSWYEPEAEAIFSNAGPPVTTTVREVGLIDSFKEVTPSVVDPGPDNTLTYTVHVVNSSAVTLSGVTVYDLLPWQYSTYQRDAMASSGQIISDIVSFRWTGDVAASSEEIITATVLVDPEFQGPIVNTAIISHPTLIEEVVVEAVTLVFAKPVLTIEKTARPATLEPGEELTYAIRVVNMGLPATDLAIRDTVPDNSTYVPGSASGNGQLVGDEVVWRLAELGYEMETSFTFRVVAGEGPQIVNDHYQVSSAEGAVALGRPVVSRVVGGPGELYLPVVLK